MRLNQVTYHVNKDKIDSILGVEDKSDNPEKYDIERIKQSGFLAQEVEQAALETGYDFSGKKSRLMKTRHSQSVIANLWFHLLKLFKNNRSSSKNYNWKSQSLIKQYCCITLLLLINSICKLQFDENLLPAIIWKKLIMRTQDQLVPFNSPNCRNIETVFGWVKEQ